MTRSDGQFPKYPRLELDPDVWPDEYFEKSRRCNECGMAWPHPHVFKASPCCGAATTLQQSPPDIRWSQALTKLFTFRFEGMYETWNEGKSDEDLNVEELRTLAETIDESEVSALVEQFVNDAAKDRAA